MNGRAVRVGWGHCGPSPLANNARREMSRSYTKHGRTRSPEYRCWGKMISRCYREHNSRYHCYGARGITVCDRWRNSFENFYADMGPRPSGLHSIDRIDNDGNYEPGNCKWSTDIEQQNNRSDNRLVEFQGRKQTVSAWAREVGIDKDVLRRRLNAGWDAEKTLTDSVARRKAPPATESDVPKVLEAYGRLRNCRKVANALFLSRSSVSSLIRNRK